LGASERLSGIPICDGEGATLYSGYAVSFSRGIRKIRHIEKFLQVVGVVSPVQARSRQLDVSCVVVWGRKQNSLRALEYAEKRQLPVLYVEDGWIRSCSANAHSRLSYSLLVDKIGVYYDATTTSSLEQFLNQPDDQFDAACGPGQLQFAKACRQRLIDSNITKYNYCKISEQSELLGDGKPLVLVIDQTMDDASVRFGGMDAPRFNSMLDKAIDENPHSRVVVRTHPDVVAGRRIGYLQERAKKLGVEISAAGDNPLPWLKQAETVFVGTSQLGYEALLCGCEVSVAGMPFYSGWGLTDDAQQVSRRTQRRTLEQLFHATHVHYARYRCPVSGNSWTLAECLDHVQLQLSYFERNAANHVCVGVTPWKKRYLAQFLRSPHGRVRFSKDADARNEEQPVVWSFTEPKNDNTEIAKTTASERSFPSINKQWMRVEDGFIRSKGLGSDFTAPASLVFDSVGLYFDASRTSALEQLLNNYQCTEDELNRARKLRALLLASNMTKYNVGVNTTVKNRGEEISAYKKVILAVGQVEGDQSIVKGTQNITSNSELLTEVRGSNPEAYIIYKPHPDVVSGNRIGAVKAEVTDRLVDRVEEARHFVDCLDESDELHTMTSLSGFEAILRQKRVVTYGLPFYAGWGLTVDRIKCDRRHAVRSIDELVFLSLVVYPHYVDIDSGEFVTIEQLVHKFAEEKSISRSFKEGGWAWKIHNVMAALKYSP